jgi:protein-tyrosine kinase
MDMLEKAVRLTVESSGVFSTTDIYERLDHCSISEISKMEQERIFSFEEMEEKKIVYPESSQINLLHKLRDIRTAAASDAENKIIMVTSIGPECGTSFFARNIAAVTAFDSTRTSLLMDCNINRPNVDKVFELGGRLGLLDYIVDKTVSIDDVIHCSGIKRYRCIPTGELRGEGGEFFTHPRFKELLTSLKVRYGDRNIFIDAPPILTSADTRILLEACDHVIVIIPYGKVKVTDLNTIEKVVYGYRL